MTDPFYVGIRDPTAVRKELLMGARDALTSLKRYEVQREIRRAKVETLFELRTVMEELMVLNRKLRQALPKTTIKAEVVRPQPKKPTHPPQHHKTATPNKKAEAVPPKQKDQLETLQDAMSRVEEQLRDLESH